MGKQILGKHLVVSTPTFSVLPTYTWLFETRMGSIEGKKKMRPLKSYHGPLHCYTLCVLLFSSVVL